MPACRRPYPRSFLAWQALALVSVWLLLLAGSPSLAAAEMEQFDWGRMPAAEWERALVGAPEPADPGPRIAYLSELFLGTPYAAGTLIGGLGRSEVLVADFGQVDCFTLLDYVEALRRSATIAEFRERLVETRYRQGRLAYDHRHHFFSDWSRAATGRLEDVTELLGNGRTITIRKQLNRGEDGELLLAGIQVQERTITVLPTAQLDQEVLAALRNGDYLGVFSDRAGLDVSHTGIFIRKGGQSFLRHASSRLGLVVDSELLPYMAGKPGLIVLRPR